MICAPTPTPTPQPFDWEPQGSALWSSGTFTANVNTAIMTAGQGGNHLDVNVNVSAAGLTTASEVRIAAFIRSGATLVGSTNRLVTLSTSDAGNQIELTLQICPSNAAVIGQPLLFEIWAAREGDHQLLSRMTSTVTPACGSGSCGTCR